MIIYKLHKPNFTKMCLNEIIMESLFIIAFQIIGLFNLMVHNYHSSFVEILQVLLIASHIEINDIIFFHMVNYPLIMVDDQ